MTRSENNGHTNGAFSEDSEVSLDIPTNTLYHTSRDCIVQEEQSGESESCLEASSGCCRSLWRNIFRKKTLYKRFPILTWLPQYKKDYIFGDIVAGISVALTVIPQALAYAGIAGLDLQYGLYACFLGCFIYIFIGSSKDVPIGPTAISALLSFQIAGGSWQIATLLTFLTGIIEILMGAFRLGFLIDFVSGPVGAGFTSAVSLIIFSSQMKDFLGIQTSGNTFLQVWISIVNDIHNISWPDFILGLICITLLLSLRALASCSVGPKEGKSSTQSLLTGIFWTVGTARNALLVCGTAGLGYWLSVSGNEDLVRTVGFVPKGMPSFQPPPFHIDPVLNETTGEVLVDGQSFWEMVSTLGSGLIVVPLIALLETMAVVQAFADGKPTDATQELIASGICNVANSFVQGLRSNGGIARGAILNASGVRTQLSNLYTSVIVIIALLYLTPCFYYIPKAALASIIIAAVVFMVQYRVIKPMWHSKKTDLIPGLGAFFACLVLPLQLGILVGIGINVVFILYQAARPKLRIETLATSNGLKYLMLTPDRCLIFPSMEFVRKVINKQGVKSTLPVVIDCTHIYGADFTAAKVISTMVMDFAQRQQPLFFYNLQPRVAQVFEGLNKDLVVIYDLTTLHSKLAEKGSA
ncbi:sodium-independent sulfate anion transporter isoform X1 [Drosophila guanche]|uniref:Blast:Sodium-independent sulfate anion transporter n=1 Tax=Drosophila guanche TaxID=7266 RepID=A0A3B0KBE7_DROGU|nr:sodium-independent sulfate anion transporter isoform X1 [Drosophila guanche]SPP80898.1 blast:Sodium-independent sulfate anion transporter [Drosophila guanche]